MAFVGVECERLKEERILLETEELPPERRGAVEAHLAACPECARKHANVEKAKDYLRTPPPPVDDKISKEKWAQMVARAKKEGAERRDAARKETPAPGRSLGLVVAIVLAILIVVGAVAVYMVKKSSVPNDDRPQTPVVNDIDFDLADKVVFDRCAAAVSFDEEEKKNALSVTTRFREQFDVLGPSSERGQVEKVRGEMRAEIRALLKPEQQKTFDDFCAARDRERPKGLK